MREIEVSVIKEAVAELCEEANLLLPPMMKEKIAVSPWRKASYVKRFSAIS